MALVSFGPAFAALCPGEWHRAVELVANPGKPVTGGLFSFFNDTTLLPRWNAPCLTPRGMLTARVVTREELAIVRSYVSGEAVQEPFPPPR